MLCFLGDHYLNISIGDGGKSLVEERVLPVLQLRLAAVLVVYLPDFDEFGPQLVFQDLQFGGIQYFFLHLFDSGVLLREDTLS